MLRYAAVPATGLRPRASDEVRLREIPDLDNCLSFRELDVALRQIRRMKRLYALDIVHKGPVAANNG